MEWLGWQELVISAGVALGALATFFTVIAKWTKWTGDDRIAAFFVKATAKVTGLPLDEKNPYKEEESK